MEQQNTENTFSEDFLTNRSEIDESKFETTTDQGNYLQGIVIYLVANQSVLKSCKSSYDKNFGFSSKCHFLRVLNYFKSLKFLTVGLTFAASYFGITCCSIWQYGLWSF